MDDSTRRICNERGQAYVETALVLVVVVIVSIILLMLFGSVLEKWGRRIVDAVENPDRVSILKVTWEAEDRAARRARPTVNARATSKVAWATVTADYAGAQTVVAATQRAEATATREAETAPTRTVVAATQEAEATATRAAAAAIWAAATATQEAEATATRAAAVATLTARIEVAQNIVPIIGWIVLGTAVLTLGVIVWILRMTPRVRLGEIWLTDENGRKLRSNEQLIEQSTCTLYFKIRLGGIWDQAPNLASLLSNPGLWAKGLFSRVKRRFSSEHTENAGFHKAPSENNKTQLNVVFFSPEDDFQLEQKVATLDLPLQGASAPVHYTVTPQQAGRCRLRACIYYRNVLLQSVLLDASVQTRPEKPKKFQESKFLRLVDLTKRVLRRLSFWNSFISYNTDYVSSTNLTLLEELPQPALSIFTNQTTDGTHWIGVYASENTTDLGLVTGDMHTFDPGELETMARKVRKVLTKIEGKETYKLSNTPPINVQGRLDQLEKDLVKLAINGYTLYDKLFFSRLDAFDRRDRLLGFDELLKRSSVISVARCKADGPTIPWAALYTYYLDTNGDIGLCERFKSQLKDNEWSQDMTKLGPVCDLLDDPQACREDSQCPLQKDVDGSTVCPFGFWGFLHQIEQPLQQVTPTPMNQIPKELRGSKFSQTSFLKHSREKMVRLAMMASPSISNVENHKKEFQALGQGSRMVVEYEEGREEVLAILRTGERHLYYFYCHGETKEDDSVFELKFGPRGHPGSISAADLDFRWIIRHSSLSQSLVILNACETAALVPERIHGFLDKLHWLGACGVVGSEIKVWSELAQLFGYQLVKRIIEGQSVGESFLDIRRHLLRQCNPLGLVYSYYSPATLHLHDPDDCKWCQDHPLERSDGS